MPRKFLAKLAAASVAVLCLAGLDVGPATADTQTINFENPPYTAGSIHSQDGWSSSGSYDQAVVANTYGFGSFGGQSFRISNAVTSGAFGDQTFAKPLANAAGEADSTNGAFSPGTLQSHFETQFDLASTQAAVQPGLAISFSPDRGDGSRMSYLRFEDGAGGINVFFDDVQGTTNPSNFVETQIAANLSRTAPHTVKLAMDFINGPSNDVVKVFIDGNLVHIGTSWENYYRYDSEASAEQSPRIVKTVIIRAGGTAVPANAGKGFLFDNMSLISQDSAASPSISTVVVNPDDMATSTAAVIANPDAWLFYNDETDTIDNSLGSFVTGPGTPPLGTGSVQISVSGTQRRNLATYGFSGTALGAITDLKFSTYNPSAGNGGGSSRSGYLHFNVDFDGSDTWQRRLVFVPSNNGTVIQDNWQEWDAINNGNAMWTYSGVTWPTTLTGPDAGVVGETGFTPRSWNDILADYPGVRIRVTDSFMGMRVGEPYADGYTENLDKFVFGTSAGITQFDFDPAPPTGSLIVHKSAIGGDDTFSFTGDNGIGSFQITTSGGSGSRTFADLAPGTYHVTENTQAGWSQASSTCDSVVVVASSTAECTVTNSKNPSPGSISGRVLVDKDGDRNLTEESRPLEGVTIYDDANRSGHFDTGEPTAVSDVNGNYTLGNLPAGDYQIRLIEPAGWMRTVPAIGYHNVTLTAGENATGKNFGVFHFGSISGFVFNDLNGDGDKDANEPGIQGWTVRLTKPGGIVVSGTTDATGRYVFSQLGPGTYRVTENSRTGWVQTTPNPAPITITTGKNSVNNNFGNKRQ